MNRHEWEAQIYASNMNTTAKMVALAMGQHGSWVDDRPLEPGLSRVADMCSMTRETVKEYVDALVEQGYLKPLGRGKYNTEKYQMMPVVADSIGILAKKKRRMNPKSTAKLRVGRDAVVADSRGQVADTSGSKLPIPPGLVADTSGLVADSIGTNIVEHSNYNIDYNLEEHSKSPVADAPVDVPSKNEKLGEGGPSSSNTSTGTLSTFNERELTEAYLNWIRPIKDDEDFKVRLKELSYDRTFEPEESRPNFRLQAAAKTINKERGVLL